VTDSSNRDTVATNHINAIVLLNSKWSDVEPQAAAYGSCVCGLNLAGHITGSTEVPATTEPWRDNATVTTRMAVWGVAILIPRF
jgi:hypothetical protein